MQYYIVDSQDKASRAIVFHDYVKSYYTFHSNSEALQVAFDSVVHSMGNCRLNKVDNDTLKVVQFSPEQPMWVKILLNKICEGGFWYVSETGEISSSSQIDKFVEEKLF